MQFLLFPFLIMLMTAGCTGQGPVEVQKKKIGDVEIAYYTRGSGEPLVMIMGFRGSMGIWDPELLKALEKHYTLILFDNRGAGLSSDSVQDLTTIEQMAADTAGLIKSLGYAKAHVLGWSMGSRIAMQLAVSYPDSVDHLILCSPNPGKNEAPRPTNAYTELTSPDFSEDKILSLIFPDTVAGKAAITAYVARLTEAVIRRTVPDDLNVNAQLIERQAHALALWTKNNKIYDDLTYVKAPTLVTGGLEDVLDSPENVKIVANQLPFAWTAYFPEAGHAFLFQDHQEFADLVHLFIESTRSMN